MKIKLPLFAVLVMYVFCGLVFAEPLLAAPKFNGADVHITCNLAQKNQGGKWQHEFVIANKSAFASAANWCIYFHQASPCIAGSVEGEVSLQGISGDYYKIEPSPRSTPLAPGTALTFTFWCHDEMERSADVPLGFYIVCKDELNKELAPELIGAVQYNRASASAVKESAGAEMRFDNNKIISLLPASEIQKIIPSPVAFTAKKGTYVINANTKIFCTEELKNEALYLQAELHKLLNINLEIVLGSGNGIQMDYGKIEYNEGYELDVNKDKIAISGYDRAGVFYGIQSLRALIPIECYGRSQAEIAVAAVLVSDHPRFKYRGNHLDVARNFQSKESVLKLLDLMAFYKLNKFQFHLTDDEGWRIEIDALPELTAVGAKRGHSADEHDMLMPAYGSGPFANAAKSAGTGFYTKSDFVEILKYAAQRHIEVIPEIDFPGHARAAIVAMKSRYNKYIGSDSAKATEYLLSDVNDKSEYRSIQWYNDNISNVCQESTYHFLEKIIDEISKMYTEAGLQLKMVHTGGDEVPHPTPANPDAGAWVKSPLCIAFMKQSEKYKKPEDLFYYFVERFSKILAAKNIATAGWEEIALKKEKRNGTRTAKINEEFVAQHFTPYVWNTVWSWGAEDRGYKLANYGYPVVLSNVNHLYFDLAVDDDPLENGQTWGGYVNCRKPWDFIPLNMYNGRPKDPTGKELPGDYFLNMERLTAKGEENVLGIQGQLWTETVKSAEMMEYMMFPKMISMAERAWAPNPAWAKITDKEAFDKAADAAWNSFANTLGQRDLLRIEHLAADSRVHFRVPPPGVKKQNGKLYANCELPGFAILYSFDKITWTTYSAPIPVVMGVANYFKTTDVKGRESRIVEVR